VTITTIYNETIGKVLIRLVQTPKGLAAVAVKDGTRTEPIYGDDAEELLSQVRREIAQINPDYFGFDGAQARFLKLFPGGFDDPEFDREERDYKVAASAALSDAVPLEKARAADAEVCKALVKIFGRTNLLSSFEQIRIRNVLLGPHGPAFARAAAQFTDGDLAGGLAGMEVALKAHGPASWPLVTYLPFLWRPNDHMYLKPQVTRDFADRVGHPFAQAYSAGLKPAVYKSLMELVTQTEAEISDLQPRDYIDIQSFIWVVGAYEEAAASIEIQPAE